MTHEEAIDLLRRIDAAAEKSGPAAIVMIEEEYDSEWREEAEFADLNEALRDLRRTRLMEGW